MQNWCEHLQEFSDGMFYSPENVIGAKGGIKTMWKFCPICGKERPKEKEKLADKMFKVKPQ